MLSATRVIGHKEYAQGRKSDPVYDMNWRRARVASFKPRTGGTSTPTQEEEDMIRYVFIKQKGNKPWFAWEGPGHPRFDVNAEEKAALVKGGLAKDVASDLSDATFSDIPRG